ncbi:hypothetical protein FGB62_28g122 [Gracilaria domingensis]|nr:hypothetical protein FGB62_28g122 [Gracilaria domingensis]
MGLSNIVEGTKYTAQQLDGYLTAVGNHNWGPEQGWDVYDPEVHSIVPLQQQHMAGEDPFGNDDTVMVAAENYESPALPPSAPVQATPPTSVAAPVPSGPANPQAAAHPPGRAAQGPLRWRDTERSGSSQPRLDGALQPSWSQ